jgi:hypothetical protein
VNERPFPGYASGSIPTERKIAAGPASHESRDRLFFESVAPSLVDFAGIRMTLQKRAIAVGETKILPGLAWERGKSADGLGREFFEIK